MIFVEPTRDQALLDARGNAKMKASGFRPTRFPICVMFAFHVLHPVDFSVETVAVQVVSSVLHVSETNDHAPEPSILREPTP